MKNCYKCGELTYRVSNETQQLAPFCRKLGVETNCLAPVCNEKKWHGIERKVNTEEPA